MDPSASPSDPDPLEEDRHRVLLDAITDYAIYMLDASGRVSSWNAGARRLKGYEPDEILGEHFSRFYTPEDRASGLPETALRMAREEGRFEREGWRLRKDGEPFWAHVVIDPILRPDGSCAGYAKVTRDLTERRRVEESLRRSEEQFRLLVQGVTDYAIYMLDAEGVVSSWNPGAERIKGYARDEIVGEHFSRFYTPEERELGVPELALKAAAREGRFEREGLRVRKDGTRFWAHVIIDPIRSGTGEIIGFAKVTRDITERVEAQKALVEAREALLQSQKLDAIGQLTGGVAHDFNNLLMAVLGSLELLKKRLPKDPKAVALLENAVQGAQRGAALTQRMLAFARKQELKFEAVDVGSLIVGMTGLVRRSLGPNVRLSTRIEGELPPARSDANQLETALLNLVLNGRDAMAGGGELRTGAFAVEAGEAAPRPLPEGRYVVVFVEDDGAGMDAETLQRAMEPFFTTKGIGKGTGLGLSMVHGMAQQSGGGLVLTSRPGLGTRAEIWLPVAEEGSVAEAEVDPVAGGDRHGAPGEEPRRLRVLAVDDDDLVLMNLVAMLEDLGHQTAAAASAGEALERLEQEVFDAVITDYAMPKMTGLELGAEIMKRRPGLPVILASGYAELPQNATPVLERLSKPYKQSALARALEALPA